MDPISVLYESSHNGDIDTFHHLIEDDPLLLVRITDASLPETPLHTAILEDQLHLAMEMLKRQPQLTRIRDKFGSYPLHLASAKGHRNVVRSILNIDSSLSQIRDKGGRTPIHVAAANDRVDVLKEFASVNENFARQVTDWGETLLHVCVRYNWFEAAKYLVELDEELVNMKDGRGNSVLHLATAEKQVEMLNLFLTRPNVNVNAVNNNGFTALDVLLQCPSERCDKEIVKILLNFGGKIGQEPSSPPPPAQTNNPEDRAQSWKRFLPSNWDPWLKKDKKWITNMHQSLLIAATIIATVTFQAGLNPPGGFTPPDPPQAGHSPSSNAMETYRTIAGTAVLGSYLEMFLYYDLIAMTASLSVILLQISGFPLKYRFTTWLLVMFMWVAAVAMILAFAEGTHLIMEYWSGTQPLLAYVLCSWIGIIGLTILWRFIILVVIFMKGIPWKKIAAFIVCGMRGR